MTTVLLIHGIPGSAATWNRVAALREPLHQVLAPDLLGFGRQPIPGLPEALLAPSQARRLLDVLDRAQINRVAVVGHDFGGPVAAHLIAAAPERVTALALFATNAFPDTPIPFPLSTLNVPIVGPIVERLLLSRSALAMMIRRGVGRPKPQLELAQYLGDARQQTAIATIFAASLRRMGELYTPVEAALRSVSVPTLVGWGTRDPFFPVATGQRTAQLIAHSRFRVYEGAGHFLPEERPEAVADDLLGLFALADPAPHFQPL